MTFFNDPEQLKFELFDYDGNTKDDPIGDCTLNLDKNIYDPDNEGFNGRIKLQNCKSGELEVKVFARKLIPAKLEKRTDDLQNAVENNDNTIKTKEQEINDTKSKNEALEKEIEETQTNIATVNAEISNQQNQLKTKEEEGINHIFHHSLRIIRIIYNLHDFFSSICCFHCFFLCFLIFAHFRSVFV